MFYLNWLAWLVLIFENFLPRVKTGLEMVKMTKIKYCALVSCIALLSACASTPEPETDNTAGSSETAIIPAPQPVQPPVTSRPAQPFPPVTGNIIQPPVPGSVADFAYQSGGDARVYFGYDQYDLTPEAREALRRQAQWLQIYSQVTAVIEGNADERGTREYNLALGARRAESIKAFLVSQGVAPSRLTTVSYGKERPIDGRSNETGWAVNRNGHTNLMSGTIG